MALVHRARGHGAAEPISGVRRRLVTARVSIFPLRPGADHAPLPLLVAPTTTRKTLALIAESQ